MSEEKQKEENTIITAAVYTTMRARDIGHDDTTGRSMPYYDLPWEQASLRTHEDFVKKVKLIRSGGSEESLYALSPAKVKADDVAAQEYKVEGAGEGEHKALKEGDTVPYEDLPIEDKMWFTLFVETVHTMHRVLTPPINADRLTRAKQKASER